MWFLFEIFIKIKTENVSGAVSGNLLSIYRVNTGENTVIEYVKYDID